MHYQLAVNINIVTRRCSDVINPVMALLRYFQQCADLLPKPDGPLSTVVAMCSVESYEVETVARGYHVYVAVWEAAVGQIGCLASEREATSMVPTLSPLSRKVLMSGTCSSCLSISFVISCMPTHYSRCGHLPHPQRLFPTIRESFNRKNLNFSNSRKFSLAKDSRYTVI